MVATVNLVDDYCNLVTDIPNGTRCRLFCPVSKAPLRRVPDLESTSGAHYYGLYLTPRLADSEMVVISDIWGHYHSRIVDNFEIISSWVAAQEEL